MSFAQALFDYSAVEEDELSFSKGEILEIVQKDVDGDSAWWIGKIEGYTGAFPRNFVKEIDQAQPHIESQTDIDKTSNSQPQLNESEYSNVAHSYYENGGYYDEHGGYYDEYGGYYDAEGNYYDTHGNFYDKESVAAYHGYNESHIENPTEIHEHTEPQITIDQSEQTKENEDSNSQDHILESGQEQEIKSKKLRKEKEKKTDGINQTHQNGRERGNKKNYKESHSKTNVEKQKTNDLSASKKSVGKEKPGPVQTNERKKDQETDSSRGEELIMAQVRRDLEREEEMTKKIAKMLDEKFRQELQRRDEMIVNLQDALVDMRKNVARMANEKRKQALSAGDATPREDRISAKPRANSVQLDSEKEKHPQDVQKSKSKEKGTTKKNDKRAQEKKHHTQELASFGHAQSKIQDPISPKELALDNVDEIHNPEHYDSKSSAHDRYTDRLGGSRKSLSPEFSITSNDSGSISLMVEANHSMASLEVTPRISDPTESQAKSERTPKPREWKRKSRAQNNETKSELEWKHAEIVQNTDRESETGRDTNLPKISALQSADLSDFGQGVPDENLSRKQKDALENQFVNRSPLRNEEGRLVLCNNIPRVAGNEFVEEERDERSRRAGGQAYKELYSRLAIKYPPCRSAVFPTTDYVEEQTDTSLPDSTLVLDFIHGYNGSGPTKSRNLFVLRSGEIIFYAAATVVMYDRERHKQRFFREHTEEIGSITVHHKGRIVASGQGGRNPSILVWDSGARKKTQPITTDPEDTVILSVLDHHTRAVCAVCFTPDGNLLASAGSDDGHTIAIWDWQRTQLLCTARGGNSTMFEMMFNPYQFTGSRDVQDPDLVSYTMVTCGVRYIKFWTLKRVVDPTPTREQEETWVPSPVRRQAKPSNRKVWKLEGNPGIFGKKVDVQDITCLIFLPTTGKAHHARCYSGTAEGHLYIWSQPRARALTEYDTEGRPVSVLAWEPHGKLVGVIPNVHNGGVQCLEFYPLTNRLMSGGRDSSLCLWNLQLDDTGRMSHSVLKTLTLPSDVGRASHPRSIAWLSESQLCIGTTNNSIYTVDTESNSMKAVVQAHNGAVEGIACHPNGKIFATVSQDKTLRVWELTSCSRLNAIRLPDKAFCVDFSSDGSMIAVGLKNGDILVYALENIESNISVKQIVHKTVSQANATSILPLETSVVVDRPKRSQMNHEIRNIKFSPDSSMLAMACRDNSIYILDVERGFKRQAVCKGHSSNVTHMDWSEDNEMLQTNDATNEILYWEARQGRQFRLALQMRDTKWHTWTCRLGWPVQGVWQSASEGLDITALDRSHDETTLVAADNTGKIKLFRFPCLIGCDYEEHAGHTSPIACVRFNVTNEYVVSGGHDYCIFQWQHLPVSD